VRGILHRAPAKFEVPGAEWVSADLSVTADAQRALRGVEALFHCAATTSGAAVMHATPNVHVTENAVMNARLFEAAMLEKVERVLFLSSSVVYPPVDEPVAESRGFEGDPFDLYFGVGWMKRHTEKLAAFYGSRFGMKCALVRPTNVYGPWDKFDPQTSHVLPALIRRAVAKEDPYEVWGDGTAERDFVYVDDMVEALLIAMEKADASARPVNFATGSLVTIRQSVELILSITGHKVTPRFDASKPTTIPRRRLDLTHSKAHLGYGAKVPFEEGLRRTIDWYRKQGAR
jgi:GDP-L-fucose synthase